MVHWMVDMGLMDQGPEVLPAPEARLLCNHALSGPEGGHDCNPRTLAGRGAVVLGRVEAVEGSKLRIGPGLAETLAAGDAFLREIRKKIDAYVTASKRAEPEPEPEEPIAALPSPRELNLRAAGVGSVIWSNGFRPDHSWIDGLEVDAQGFPIHDQGATTMRGLYFVGLPWLRKRKSSLFLGVGEDAEHVVAHLESLLDPLRRHRAASLE
jgi:putative flavoprotein involved in K+ transport